MSVERVSVRVSAESESECRDSVLLNVDTQLGAFGPGADPTRRRAAIPATALARMDSGEKLWCENYRPKSIKNRSKIDKKLINKSTNNRPKIYQNRQRIDQKSTKNRPTIEIWKALGHVWRRMWPAWAIQGFLRVIFGRFGGV